MRGKAFHCFIWGIIFGITPAYAGKRVVSFLYCLAFEDHPRVCGEKRQDRLDYYVPQGSPPRMRGKEVASFLYCLTSGDHPRVCGEKRKTKSLEYCLDGITPAYAGKRLKRSRSTVPHAAIVPLFPSVCNKPAGSDGSPAGHDAPPFLPIENAAPASPAYNLRSL